ncbi:hypothetical protein [Georgenia sp. AZ-5]|uniref:hypothetical protein n=1 Tax=Georgenia sp. AZ-5 TaxID=3367526 RepID=UPI003754E97D
MALKDRTSGRLAAAGLAVAAALALAACDEDDTAGPETGADAGTQEGADAVVDPYVGPYDTPFYSDINSYSGQEVTVSGDVDEIVSATAFTIAGTEDTDVAPLLVVSTTEVGGLEPDMTVSVTGTVHEAFDLATLEEQAGTDLDDELFDVWDGEPYIDASSVDTSVASDQ